MRKLTKLETSCASGAGYDIYAYDDSTAKYITINTQVTDPVKLGIDAITAATWGAAAGALAGGPVGALTGAIFASTGVAIATMVTDAYNMYMSAKNK